MWFSEFKEDWNNIFERILTQEKESIDLGQLFAAVYSINPHTEGGLSVRREQTLSYLHTLLTEGKVIVQLAMPRLATDAEVDEEKRNAKPPFKPEDFRYGYSKKIEYVRVYDLHTRNECIEDIRLLWKRFPSQHSDDYVHITLPENPLYKVDYWNSVNTEKFESHVSPIRTIIKDDLKHRFGDEYYIHPIERSEFVEHTLIPTLRTQLEACAIRIGYVRTIENSEWIPDHTKVASLPAFTEILGTTDEIIEFVRKNECVQDDGTFGHLYICTIPIEKPWPTVGEVGYVTYV